MPKSHGYYHAGPTCSRCGHLQLSSEKAVRLGYGQLKTFIMAVLTMFGRYCIGLTFILCQTIRIFSRISGYYIREKFPILVLLGKSFPILWSAHVVGNCHFWHFNARKPFQEGKHSLSWQGTLPYPEMSLSLAGKPFTGKEKVQCKRNHLPCSETIL